MQIVTIFTDEGRTIVGHKIECAHNSLQRLIGLLGRSTLGAGEGIWIQPSSGVHTFGMTFSIDVVGLDRDMRIVQLWRDVKPYRITSLCIRVRSVLELAAGEIEARGLHIGQKLDAVSIH